ncbi:uncharacterized protein [Rutidosis leptorrhynchoides]|uniref:uncharacterized protein n=1 Tax=Rutidosis leptorrhynchoides TaxID=125765 RepID=UPI003A9A60D7
MEEYLNYMKTLRTHMNDAEDQAAKTSVEEQMQITTIQTLKKEIDLAKSETKQLKEDSDRMMKEKGNICSQILELQRKIALLENDTSTLSQTLELIQQERVNWSAKLVEKRTSYGKINEKLSTEFKEQQDWLNSYKAGLNVGHLANTQLDCMDNGSAGNVDAKIQVMSGNLDDTYKNMMEQVDAAKAKFDQLTQMRSELASEHHEFYVQVRQLVEKLKCKMENFKPELRDMSIETLEEELQALKSDKCGETEYQETLQNQIDTVKGISHTVKCGCGEEYKLEVDLCA